MGRNLSRLTLLAAAALVAAVELLVPFGRTALYPFTLLATWVHEMGHGLGALAVGGRFVKLEIFADASGVATTASGGGWRSAAVSAAGLLAPPLLCALILGLVRTPGAASALLVALATALAASLVLWVRSWVGALAVLGLAVVFTAGSRIGSARLRLVLAQLVAVVLGLDTVTRTLGYLFVERIEGGATAGERSDVGGIADALGGPGWFWGALIAVAAVALLVLGLRAAVLPGRAPRAGAEAAPGTHAGPEFPRAP